MNDGDGQPNRRQWAGKPNSVPPAHAGWKPAPHRWRRSFIWAGGRPPARAPYPQLMNSECRIANSENPTSSIGCSEFDIRYSTERAAPRCLFGLAGGGVYPAASVTTRAVRSYRTISPLPRAHQVRLAFGGIFSVALSLGLRRVGVTNHRTLSSSDFPPASEPMPAIAFAHCRLFGCQSAMAGGHRPRWDYMRGGNPAYLCGNGPARQAAGACHVRRRRAGGAVS